MNKWEKFFIELANTCASQSTCLRRKVGAVLVLDNRVLSMGYNGAPSKTSHCSHRGCIREKLKIPSGERHEMCVGAHAEANAIATAAKHGVSINDSSLYCTTFPCSQCAKLIINSGIKEVFYMEGYPDDLTSELFKEAEIKCVKLLDDKDQEIIHCPQCRSMKVLELKRGHRCVECNYYWCDFYDPILKDSVKNCSNCSKCAECYK